MCRVRTRKNYSITFLLILGFTSLQDKFIVPIFVSAHGVSVVQFIYQ
jgi:hypothetical protein